jgi:type I restriction enzyme M protein
LNLIILFRGGAEQEIRKKLLKDNNIDTVIGLPPNLFYSTGILVCILVLKKCKKFDDVLFINASEYFEKGKSQNYLREEDIQKIVETYTHRKAEPRYSKRIPLDVIEKEHDFNLNISRYVATAKPEEEVDLSEVHAQLVAINKRSEEARAKHNGFLKELGLKAI